MHNPKLAILIAIATLTAIVLAQFMDYQPDQIGTCYPEACVGTDVNIAQYPTLSTRAQALVASGSAPFRDIYNFSMLLRASLVASGRPAGLSDYLPALIRNAWRVPGINIGFNQWGEFVAVIPDPSNPTIKIGGGIAVANYSRPDQFWRSESWATTIIPPRDWINGWAFAANITFRGTSNAYCIRFVAFATYSNTIHPGGGKGAAVNITRGTACRVDTPWPESVGYWKVIYPNEPSISLAPLHIIIDTPRLLIARGSVLIDATPAITQVWTSRGWTELSGFALMLNVTYTLVFPKAFPYAVIYYNWTLTSSVSKFADRAWLNETAFTVRYEIDFYNDHGSLLTADMRYYEYLGMIRSRGWDYFVATPHGDESLLFFSAVFPNATEFDVHNPGRLPPSINDPIYLKIFLPTGHENPAGVAQVPFVIHQWKKNYGTTREYYAGFPLRVSNGSLFVYGMITNGSKAYEAMMYVLNATIFSARFDGFAGGWRPDGTLKNATWIAAGRDALPTDVIGAVYVARPFLGTIYNMWNPNTANANFTAVDLSPLDYPTYGADTIPSLINGSTAFGVPYFDYFVGAYGVRTFLKSYFRINNTANPAMFANYSVAGSYIATVGGPVPNFVTRYAQDFGWYSPFAPAASWVVPAGSVFVPVWNVYRVFTSTFAERAPASAPPAAPYRGYAVIGVAHDANGTTIFQVWGYTAEDTYWAAYLLSRNSTFVQFLTDNATMAILTLDYTFAGLNLADARPFVGMPQRFRVWFYHPALGLVGIRNGRVVG